jgi:hypothetical protein
MAGFDYKHYIPILRSKRAEWHALSHLRENSANIEHLTPLIEIVPTAFVRKSDSGPIDLPISEVVAKTVGYVLKCWRQSPIFVDCWHLDSTKINQADTLRELGEQSQREGLSIIPVTGLSRNKSYQTVAAQLSSINNRGACIRLIRQDLLIPNLSEKIDSILSELNLRPEQTDVLLDFQKIEQSTDLNYSRVCESFPYLLDWRSLTIASGAFPKDLSELERNRQHELKRLDWSTWQEQVSTGSRLKRRPSFSDYTIQHPIYSEPPERPNFSASIRYTAKNHWVIMRGEGLFHKGSPGAIQWPANAQLLVERPEFCGKDFSYGDAYIFAESLELGKPPSVKVKSGNAETWISAGINHHVAFVLHQIASLHDTSIGGAL